MEGNKGKTILEKKKEWVHFGQVFEVPMGVQLAYEVVDY